MNRSSRRLPHLRGLVVALVAIALSAGVALAARPATAPPDAAADGLDRATEVSGRTVPAEVVHPDVPARPTQVAEEPANDEPTTDESAEIDEPDRPMNHGWFVSEAATTETPAGYDSHGAYVSSIAKGDAGKPSGSTGAGGTSPGGTKAAEGQAKAAEAMAAASERKGGGNASGD